MKRRDPYSNDHDVIWASVVLIIAGLLAWIVWVMVSPMGNL